MIARCNKDCNACPFQLIACGISFCEWELFQNDKENNTNNNNISNNNNITGNK